MRGEVSPNSVRASQSPGQLHPTDDVAPLVGAAQLQGAPVSAADLEKIVGLQNHVVELKERQLLLAVEAEA